ncbi:hypothetical protein Pfo_019325, partial [Paulownia fortunei]
EFLFTTCTMGHNDHMHGPEIMTKEIKRRLIPLKNNLSCTISMTFCFVHIKHARTHVLNAPESMHKDCFGKNYFENVEKMKGCLFLFLKKNISFNVDAFSCKF